MIGTPTNDKMGAPSAWPSSHGRRPGCAYKVLIPAMELAVRLDPGLKGTTIKLGVLPNGWVPWEVRPVRLPVHQPDARELLQPVVGTSRHRDRGSDQVGEKTYVDYEAGVYDNANFHAFERADTKETIDRLTVYPFGALWRFDGLGITGMYNYGYGT